MKASTVVIAKNGAKKQSSWIATVRIAHLAMTELLSAN
jgi:hypothetical protein